MIFDFRPVQDFLIYSILLVVFHVGWMIKDIKVLKGAIARAFGRISGICMPSELYWDSLFGWEMLSTILHAIQIDLNKKIKLYEKAFDFPVIALDENNNNNNKENVPSSLFAHTRGNRPLVLNFGSCTCPVFTYQLSKFRAIVKEFEDVADFALVYIEEAHPADGWAFQSDLQIKTHHSIEDRCNAARILQTKFNPGCPVLVDSMLDTGNIAYGATPIRLHVVQNDILMYQGGPGPFQYNLDELREWLASQFKNNS